MVYRVKTRKGYWEERESYRDPVTGKPRSRFRKYLGKVLGPAADISLTASLRSEPGVAAVERAQEKAEKERGPVVEEASRLPTGLHIGPTNPIPVEPSHTAPAPPSEPEPSAPPESPSEQPSGPGADAAPSSVSER